MKFTHDTVKHLTVKVRFLQECVQRKIIVIAYIKMIEKNSDIMNNLKQSEGPEFAQHRDNALGIHNAINIVTAAVDEILRWIRIYV